MVTQIKSELCVLLEKPVSDITALCLKRSYSPFSSQCLKLDQCQGCTTGLSAHKGQRKLCCAN